MGYLQGEIEKELERRRARENAEALAMGRGRINEIADREIRGGSLTPEGEKAIANEIRSLQGVLARAGIPLVGTLQAIDKKFERDDARDGGRLARGGG